MELFDTILAFMDKGGNVLWIIATLVFFMWTLIIERFIFFLGGGWKAENGGSAFHEAALPLQKQPRPSRYPQNDEPDEVVIRRT